MTRWIVPCVLMAGLAGGCMEGKKATPLTRTPSLYTRLGGEPAITVVVDDFVTNMITSPSIRDVHKSHFLKPDVHPLKRKLIDQIGEATGGPQKYKGKSMKDAHVGLAITEADFKATVDALVKALDKNGVGEKEKTELLALLGPMKADIVESKQ